MLSLALPSNPFNFISKQTGPGPGPGPGWDWLWPSSCTPSGRVVWQFSSVRISKECVVQKVDRKGADRMIDFLKRPFQKAVPPGREVMSLCKCVFPTGWGKPSDMHGNCSFFEVQVPNPMWLLIIMSGIKAWGLFSIRTVRELMKLDVVFILRLFERMQLLLLEPVSFKTDWFSHQT